jgi:hypothetical protein
MRRQKKQSAKFSTKHWLSDFTTLHLHSLWEFLCKERKKLESKQLRKTVLARTMKYYLYECFLRMVCQAGVDFMNQFWPKTFVTIYSIPEIRTKLRSKISHHFEQRTWFRQH